jgi:hypothetical protein
MLTIWIANQRNTYQNVSLDFSLCIAWKESNFDNKESENSLIINGLFTLIDVSPH